MTKSASLAKVKAGSISITDKMDKIRFMFFCFNYKFGAKIASILLHMKDNYQYDK